MNTNDKETLKLKSQYNDLDLNQYLEYGFSKAEILRLKEAFDLFDINEKGVLDINDLQKSLNELGIMSKNKELFNLVNEDKREIDFNTFVELFGARPVCHTEEEAKKLYAIFLGDYDLNKKLSANDLRRVAGELGLELGDNEVEEMIKSVNPEEPDCISFDEFFRIMSKMEM